MPTVQINSTFLLIAAISAFALYHAWKFVRSQVGRARSSRNIRIGSEAAKREAEAARTERLIAALEALSTPEALDIGNKYLEGIQRACESMVRSISTLEPSVDRLAGLFTESHTGAETKADPVSTLNPGTLGSIEDLLRDPNLPHPQYSAAESSEIQLRAMGLIASGMKPPEAMAQARDMVEKKTAMGSMTDEEAES